METETARTLVEIDEVRASVVGLRDLFYREVVAAIFVVGAMRGVEIFHRDVRRGHAEFAARPGTRSRAGSADPSGRRTARDGAFRHLVRQLVRRVAVVDRQVRHEAAGLALARARRERRERTARGRSIRDVDREADRHRDEQARAHRRIAIEALLQQPRGHLRALRVADDHDPVAAIEAREIRVERRRDIRVRDLEEVVLIALRREVGRDRRLAIQRRVDVADLGEPRDLRRRRLPDLREIGEVDVVARDDAEVDGRIDVEAIESAVARGRVRFDRPHAIRADHGRREVAAARIARKIRATHPPPITGSR